MNKLTYCGILCWVMAMINLAFSYGALSDHIHETARGLSDKSFMFLWIGLIAIVAGQEITRIEKGRSGHEPESVASPFGKYALLFNVLLFSIVALVLLDSFLKLR